MVVAVNTSLRRIYTSDYSKFLCTQAGLNRRPRLRSRTYLIYALERAADSGLRLTEADRRLEFGPSAKILGVCS